MNIFSYGRIYSQLSVEQIGKIDISSQVNKEFLFLSKIYFYLFGYPDVASQRRYIIVEKPLHLKKHESVLDAGCGNGIYLQEFGRKFLTNGYGVDARSNRINSALKINKFLGRNDVFKTSTLEKLNLGTKNFDKIICLEVLEHIVDDKSVVKRLSKNLSKKGLFVITVPMKGTGLSKEQENDPHFKPEKYEHVRSGYTEQELRKLANDANLKVVSVQKYFFFVSRYLVRFQQFLYKRDLIVLNLLLSPVLLMLSQLDDLVRVYPRGYIMILQKKHK